MRCEKFLERFDRAEPGLPFGPLMNLHLSRCSSCRAEVARFESAMSALKEEEDAVFETFVRRERLEERTMTAIRLVPKPRRELSMAQWALPGIIVASSCVFLPMFARFSGLSDQGLALWSALVLGVALTLFGSIFVGSHVDTLREGLERRKAGLPAGLAR